MFLQIVFVIFAIFCTVYVMYICSQDYSDEELNDEYKALDTPAYLRKLSDAELNKLQQELN